MVIALLAVTPVLRAADRERVREVGRNFICICGCNQILPDCNHLGCPSSTPLMTEVAALIDSGMSEEEIVAVFSEKYGYTVRSSPPASGFNLLAYLLPVLALAIGVTVAIYVARTWKSTSVAHAGPSPEAVDTSKYSRVEEELKKFTPED